MHAVTRVARRLYSGLRPLGVAALLFALTLMAQATFGQGTSGTVPDPISTSELMEYGARLKLSRQQIAAVQGLHDAYKREFRELREGDIAKFMQEVRDMQGMGMMPDRPALVRMLERMEAVNRRIAETDNRLFDAMTPVLTEPQLAMMPRVRQARQRSRCASQQIIWFAGQQPPDLSRLLNGVELTPDQEASADAVLAPYEAKLTNDLTKLYEMMSRLWLDVYDAMLKAGLNEKSFEDAENGQKNMELMQSIWAETTAKGMAAAQEIAELNKRTARSLAAVLPADASRSFRYRHHQAAYPESGLDPQHVDGALARAAKLEDLTEEQRQAVSAARADFQGKCDSLMEEIAAALDELRANQNAMNFDQDHWQRRQEVLNKLQQRGSELRSATLAALSLAIGDELANQVMHEIASAEVEVESEPAVAVDPSDDPAFNAELQGDSDDMMQWGPDQFLPPRIGPRELNDYMAMLGLDKDQRVTVQQMHKEYTKESRTMEAEGAIARLQQHVQTMWNFEEGEDRPRGPSGDQVEESYRLRRAALDEILKLDQGFFDDIELAVLRPEQAAALARVRQARERVTYNRGEMLMWANDGAMEPSIDLARVVRRQRLSPQLLASVESMLQEHEGKVTPMMRQRYDDSLAYMRAQEQWNIEASGFEGGDFQAMGDRYRTLLEAPMRKLSEINASIAQLNRDTLSRLMSALPAAEADALRRDYNLRAFPNVYADPAAMDKRLADALQLADLTDDQRRILSELAVEYRPAYDALCEQLVARTGAGADMTRMFGGDGEDWRKMQEKQEEMERLRFDRDELNQRARATLRATLTEDQIKRIGGLPEPQEQTVWD